MNKNARALSALFVCGFLLAGFYAVNGALVPGMLGEQTDLVSPDDASPSDKPFEFSEVSAQVGINYTYTEGPSITATGSNVMGNPTVSVADYNGDDWPDLLLLGGEDPVIYENLGGTFEPSGALPELDRDLRSALFFDYDNDGSVDLLLLADGEKPLLLENVDGQFEKRDAGFDERLSLPAGATTADFDHDGCLDVFVIQHGNWSETLPRGFKNYSAPDHNDNGNPNKLYLGDCSTFTQVDDAGIEGARWSLATNTADLNDDGRMDIHVANDFNHDVVYFNRGNGSFEQSLLSEKTNRNGMSSEIADVNGDGLLDIFVTNIFYPEWAAEQISTTLSNKSRGNNLLVNQGNGTFVDRAEAYDANNGGWGWAATIADLNNDGDRDLFHATQTVAFDHRVQFSDEEKRRLSHLDFYSAPVLLQKVNGSFDHVSALESGFKRHDGRGVARLDFDRDGDLDILVTTTDSYRLYRNGLTDGNAVQISVEDEDGSLALGADVYVKPTNADAAPRRYHISPNTDFHSQQTGLVHVGMGNATSVDVRVVWPDGTERTFRVRNGRRVIVSPAGITDSVAFEESAS